LLEVEGSVSDTELVVIFTSSRMKPEQVNHRQRLREDTRNKNVSAELGLLFRALYFPQPLFAQGHA